MGFRVSRSYASIDSFNFRIALCHLVLVYVADCRRLDRGPDINSGLDFRFNLRPTNKGIYFRSIFFFLFIYLGNELISSLMISFLQ